MIYKNCALFKKSLSVIALSLAFQSPYALAMENEQYETVLSNTTLPADCIHNVIVDSDLDTKVKGWSLTCSKLRHFTLGTIFFIPKNVFKITDLFRNLTKLDANNTTTDEALSQLTKLTQLSLCGHASAITNEALSNLKNLSRLCLKNNSKITDETLSQLTKLTQLSLSGNITITDEALSNLKNLSRLCLKNNCKITDKGLNNLIDLTELDLSCNDAITDAALSQLIGLKKLDLTFNDKITGSEFSKLENLNRLSLLGSGDLFLGESLCFLPNLTELDLRGYYCNTVTDGILSKCTNLTKLNLWRNKTITIEALNHLTNLIHLELNQSHNSITEESLRHLPKLTHLIDKSERFKIF